MRNKAIIISLIVVVALGYFFWCKPKFGQAGAMNPPVASALEVGAVKLQKQKVQLFLELPARVSSYKIAAVRPQVEGVIKRHKFVEGSFVKEGQQLYQIDPAMYQASFDDANENFKTLRAKINRYKNLLTEDAVSRQEFDDVAAAFAKAESDMKKARTNLSYTRVLAPISGYVGKSNFTEGALVTANQDDALTTITQLDPIYVDMVQPSKDMLRLGDQTEISVSLIIDEVAYSDMGRLKFAEKFADEGTDSVRLRAIFTNKNQKLIPGMFVNAKLHLRPIEAITVPQRATNRAADGSLTIWVVEEGDVAKPRVIKAEQASGDAWVVTEGLEDGDVIIVEGFLKLADGAKVKPVFADPVQQVVAQEPVAEPVAVKPKPAKKASKHRAKTKKIKKRKK